MVFHLEDSRIWRNTLAHRDGDQFQAQRDKLRVALLSMRNRVIQLIKSIPEDCKGLTVHDETHLDALWEMADLLIGNGIELTPVESFVLGASILIHDAGMTVASFPRGLDEIAETVEWRDIAHAVMSRQNLKPITAELIKRPPLELRGEIIFGSLRTLHAKQASKLLDIHWIMPNGDNVQLLDDTELRDAYGRHIGRIAYSHHWPIEQVAEELRTDVGMATSLPKEWTLNEVKVACLLRCVDAAHIDHRRAPTLLYALTQPKGISSIHWGFQNNLLKPNVNDSALTYTSGKPFTVDQAAAWWLCFDTIKMIHAEIVSSNSLLQDLGIGKLTVNRVSGADNTRTLAKFVETEGWTPINAQITVSDPVNLAITLGGKNLYGRGPVPAIRELLQNAVDAVRARRNFDGRASTWGDIRLIVEKITSAKGEEIWLHCDDNGIGMSERILTGPLLDFGKSFWHSTMAREEFPGLEASGLRPIGKFGIGFFAVFLLGGVVRVISKRFDAAQNDARTLEFESVASKPILRHSRKDELPQDFSTRVSIRIEKAEILSAAERPSRGSKGKASIFDIARQLVSGLDVNVQFEDRIEGKKYTHSANWVTSPADKFIGELYSLSEEPEKDYLVKTSNLIDVLRDEEGDVLGRAGLYFGRVARERRAYGACFASVGGFVCQPTGSGNLTRLIRFSFGLFNAESELANRQVGTIAVPDEVIAKWATSQADKIYKDNYLIYDRIDAAQRVHRLGGDPGVLPFAFFMGDFLSREDLRSKIRSRDDVGVLLSKYTYDDSFAEVSIAAMPSVLLLSKPSAPIILISPFADDTQNVITRDAGRRIMSSGGKIGPINELGQYASSGLMLLNDFLADEWAEDPSLSIHLINPFSGEYIIEPEPRWVLQFSREKKTL